MGGAVDSEERTQVPMNRVPADFHPERDLAVGFYDFLLTLHREFTPRQRELVAQRRAALSRSHLGILPNHRTPSEGTERRWRIEPPSWLADQRNQMTGPADEEDLVVKMLNSGAPGVMLDLEDSMANRWENLTRGIDNILQALYGDLTYFDAKRDRTISIRPGSTVLFTRPRGLHLGQDGVVPGEVMSASLFDVTSIVFRADVERLKHPLCFYIPKSESAEEALWWADLFRTLERAKGLPERTLKCMALVESHPLAYEIEEFIFNLRDYLVGLNLGRWDYMAGLIHFNLHDPEWVLPDRNTIPHDVAFFQNLRHLIPELCHKHGIPAIGGMTALYPNRQDPELNARALAVLEKDKRNEAACLFDGAWTGHPDQNEIAVAQFPAPNQLSKRRPDVERYPNLRPHPEGVGRISLEGTRAAARTTIRYRCGVLGGKGASLLDGYMEDLATDRIYRLMIAQRVRHRVEVDGAVHTEDLVARIFDEELERILAELPPDADEETRERYRRARRQTERMIRNEEFDPV